jgi:hypothetical protein
MANPTTGVPQAWPQQDIGLVVVEGGKHHHIDGVVCLGQWQPPFTHQPTAPWRLAAIRVLLPDAIAIATLSIVSFLSARRRAFVICASRDAS